MRTFVGIFGLVAVTGCAPTAGTGKPPSGGGGHVGEEVDAGIDEAFDFAIGPTCIGLECQVNHACAGGAKTTLTGKVYAPNGTLPLYNATVFVPNGPLEPMTPGVTCDRCDGKVSGNPIAIAQTDATGSFTLTDVPTGAGIPLVIQIGHWRRQVSLPNVNDCVSEELTDINLLRLPKSKSEGEIPLIAMVTGDADPFECLLRKIGVDDSEVTIPTGTGRVHYYVANGRDIQGTSAPGASTLWSNAATLAKYNMVILACEGTPNAHAGGVANLRGYLDAGGRVFATHYSYTWLNYTSPSVSPYNAVGTWHTNQTFPSDPLTGTIDQTFPKGLSFAQWLKSVAPATTLGKLSIKEARHDLDQVNATHAQQWITATDGHKVTQHMTFNTPINPPLDAMGEPQYCGRVVYSDFHVSAEAQELTGEYPSECKVQPLSAQEKALAFMLFDLSSCVQKDTDIPIP